MNVVLPFPGAIFGFAVLQGLDCYAAVRKKTEYVNEALMELYSYRDHPVIVYTAELTSPKFFP